ncbi:MltA domain-containing protein [Malikia sp.]|uniref:murein transglycosylase A n=1 Tax=Malikia sp. TaxID=2070706 RepID=UPI002603A140|nr:MltA domain-containing protein [Malikia sp.]MDD2728912.1 MltA domain-containing protein [Malikia sp.]
MNRPPPPSTAPSAGPERLLAAARRHARHSALAASALLLAACSTVDQPRPDRLPPHSAGASTVPRARIAVVTPQSSQAWQWADSQPLPAPIARGKSVWTPARWSELPGWGYDALHEAWNAWLRSCERPAAGFGPVCAEVRQLTLGGAEEQHDWLMRRLQPYRLSAPAGETKGLLTGYYEPVMSASRQAGAGFGVPLYGLPPGVRNGSAWYSRQEMERSPQAQAALRGQEIAWLADPIDALLLQIQGSGRLTITEPDGSRRQVRLAYAGNNGHPYQSVARWLLDRKLISSGSWEAIRAWALQNPQRVPEMLAANPRMVFFREEPLGELEARFGPRGAQGVALTPGRSIAVDRDSIPYGTPVWLRSAGPAAQFEKLVLAQDTGSAIVGAVRADYFTGWGDDAYTLAAGLKQPLELWALWPRSQ